jgi:glycosyltransferase involved in cell wall biosynthesis
MEEGGTRLTAAQPRIAYLVSQYPVVSHTFILREIRELRSLGLDVRVASIRAADRAFENLSADEREEQRAAFYIKPAGALPAIAAHARILFARPREYFSGFWYATRLAGSSPRRALWNLFYFVEAVVFLDWMRRQDLAHVHMHFTTTVGLIARRIAPIRTSTTIHGSGEFDDPAGFYLREKIQAFDLLCAISDYGRSQLMRHSDFSEWRKLRVARLGVDPAQYVPRPFRQTPAPFEIICVGKLAPVKGQHLLVAALHHLVSQGRPVRLRLVGNGPDRASLERNVAQRRLDQYVIFEGWQNADRVRALYQEADIFALSSFAEGIPVALMEAMAMEIPCVAPSITGIPELIRNEVDGLLVPAGNEEELARALARLLDDTGLRLHLGRSARERILEHYELSRNVARLADILREVDD